MIIGLWSISFMISSHITMYEGVVGMGNYPLCLGHVLYLLHFQLYSVQLQPFLIMH